MVVEKLTKEEWAPMNVNAHFFSFGHKIDLADERYDFTLIVKNEAHKLMFYSKCREHNASTLYLMYGGALPGTIESSMTYFAFKKMLAYCQARYKRVTALVVNTNIRALKMAFKCGFLVMGSGIVDGHIFLQLVLDFPDV